MIDALTPVRLGDQLTEAADTRAAEEGVSRAEVIRRAVVFYLDPDGAGAVAEAAQWERRPIDGHARWDGEFAYGLGEEEIMAEDWAVYTARVGDATDNQHLGVTGDPLLEVAWRSGGYLSLDSGRALARSLLAAIARQRGAYRLRED